MKAGSERRDCELIRERAVRLPGTVAAFTSGVEAGFIIQPTKLWVSGVLVVDLVAEYPVMSEELDWIVYNKDPVASTIRLCEADGLGGVG